MKTEKLEKLWKIKTPYGVKNWAYIKSLMDADTNKQEFNMEASDEAREAIAEQIKEGMTSGRLDGEQEYTYWEIKFNSWKD